MTNQEILTKAIKKAIIGGWVLLGKEAEDFKWHVFNSASLNHPQGYIKTSWSEQDYKAFDSWRSYEVTWDIMQVIFNQDFAKALWGTENGGYSAHEGAYNTGKGAPLKIIPRWQYHLQLMVVSDDPIEYLGANT